MYEIKGNDYNKHVQLGSSEIEFSAWEGARPVVAEGVVDPAARLVERGARGCVRQARNDQCSMN